MSQRRCNPEHPDDMTEPKKLKAEDVIGHAEAAALFFRTMIGEGIPVLAATQMACSYVGALLLTGEHGKEPKRPWEDPNE